MQWDSWLSPACCSGDQPYISLLAPEQALSNRVFPMCSGGPGSAHHMGIFSQHLKLVHGQVWKCNCTPGLASGNPGPFLEGVISDTPEWPSRPHVYCSAIRTRRPVSPEIR